MLIALADSVDDVAEVTARWGAPAVRSLLHDIGENDRTFGLLLEWQVDPGQLETLPSDSAAWWFEEFEQPVFAGERIDPADTDIFVVFNNALAGGEAEAEQWYRAVHVPETFTHLGFVAGWRLRDRSAGHGLQPSPFGYLTVYAVPSGQVAASERARLGLNVERAAAAARGETPSVPVPSAVTGPRYAQYYSRQTA